MKYIIKPYKIECYFCFTKGEDPKGKDCPKCRGQGYVFRNFAFKKK